MSISTRRWMGTGLTDVGRVRKHNQDSFLVSNELGLFVVADGMGGHAGGDVASRLAVEAFQAAIAPHASDVPSQTHMELHTEAFLRATVDLANTRIVEESHRCPELRHMGTTLVAVAISTDGAGHSARVIHVGDSRVYLYREGTLRQLTQDHSVVEDFVRRGLLSPAEAAVHPKRHALTRAVGIDRTVEPDYIREPLQPDDLLLLCTDGLTKMIDDHELARLLSEAEPRPASICRTLVDESNRRGGNDNITVVICMQTSAS